MSEAKRLVAAIVQFLGDQLSSSDLSTDAKESLEGMVIFLLIKLIKLISTVVAIQCLESAYDVSSSDAHLLPSKTLVEIFKDGVKGEPVKVSHQKFSKRHDCNDCVMMTGGGNPSRNTGGQG